MAAAHGGAIRKLGTVKLEELFEHQHGELLRLGEFVRALGAGILGQGFLACLQRRPRKRDRVFRRP